jgi:hypothetical protein
MRKIILAIFLLGIVNAIQAQTEKGDWLVGGRVDLNTGDNSTVIGFTPNAGIFLINNFAVGGNLSINYQKAGDTKLTSFMVGPFARYYFTTAKARPLVHAAINYISSKVKQTSFTSTNNGSYLFLGGGVAIFINENVSIEMLAGYANTKYKDFAGSGGFNLGIGFQVYLSKRQVSNLRGK